MKIRKPGCFTTFYSSHGLPLNFAALGIILCVMVPIARAASDPMPAGHFIRQSGNAVPGATTLSGTESEALTLRVNLQDKALDKISTLAALTDADGKNVVTLEVRAAGGNPKPWLEKDPNKKDLIYGYSVLQNYLPYAGPDGTLLVLEAVFNVDIKPPYLDKMKKQIRIGVPVSMLGASPKTVLLRIKPGLSELMVDGKVVDAESPCGGLAAPVTSMTVDNGVAEASVWRTFLDDKAAGHVPLSGYDGGQLTMQDLQYWTPPCPNQWVGDVMLYQDGKRMHLMYLTDRRHGGTKNAGGHEIAHMSSSDMKTWTVHPLAVPFTEPWETIGTSMMVKTGNQWKIVYGFHTDRIVSKENVSSLPGTKGIPFSDLKGIPIGAAISTSDDGIHFKKENVLVHQAQNPTVFQDPRGGFSMLGGYSAEGLFHSDDLINWTPEDHFIVPFGKAVITRNSSECFCPFEWNGWHYILGGRTGYWMSKSFAGPYWDQNSPEGQVVAKDLMGYFVNFRLKKVEDHKPVIAHPEGPVIVPRWDIYDGLWVPMVAEAPGGRRLYAGWLEGHGGPDQKWGGNLVLRELHQEPDGNLSMSWWPEAVPPTGAAVPMKWSAPGEGAVLKADAVPASITAGNAPDQYILEMDVDSKTPESAYSIILGGSGELKDGCELRVEPQLKRAQWGQPANGQLAPETPDAAAIALTPDGKNPVFAQHNGNTHWRGFDFAIAGVEGLDKPHHVRIAFIHDRKSNSHIIDAEIAGRRTMITRRRDLTGHDIQLVAGKGAVSFSNVSVKPVERPFNTILKAAAEL